MTRDRQWEREAASVLAVVAMLFLLAYAARMLFALPEG